MSPPVASVPPRPVRGAALAAVLGLGLAEAEEIVQFLVALAHLRHSPSTPLGHTAVLNLLQVAAIAVAGIAFLVWLFQARREAEAIGGAVQRWSSGWVVGSWFVPGMSLWVPRRIVLDIWRAGEGGRLTRPASILLNMWWACFLAESVGSTTLRSALTLHHATEVANVVAVVRALLGIAAAWLGRYVVREITRSHGIADRRAPVNTPVSTPVAAPTEASAAEATPAPPTAPIPDSVRYRQNILIAVLFAVFITAIVGVVSFRSHTGHPDVNPGPDPDKLGYAFGTANPGPDPDSNACETEARRRYQDQYQVDTFTLGCLQAQLDILNKEAGG